MSDINSKTRLVALLVVGLTLVPMPQTVMAQQSQTDLHAESYRYVTGYVRDKQGETLPGVSVRIEDTDLVTVTDANGHYSLSAPTRGCKISFRYLGMSTVTLPIKTGQKNLSKDVVMDGDNVLNEVVVTGYQTLSRERATGSYSIINADDLMSRHATNLAEALDGLIAGVQSKDDGRGSKQFAIRGTSTMLADNTPLVVVDGFPIMDNQSDGASKNPNLSALERINPNDIESITVLKDAAAASIWGARSANGVIVITTKKNKNKNSLSLEGNIQLTIGQKQDVAHLTNLSSSSQMINYQRWAFEHGMIGTEYTGDLGSLYNAINHSELLMYEGYRWGIISMEDMNRQLALLSATDNRGQIKKELLRTPLTSNTTAAISGNVGNWNTRFSANYIYDTGDFIGHRDNTWRLNWENHYRLNRRLSVSASLNLVQSNRHTSQMGVTNLSELSPYEQLIGNDGGYAKNWHPEYNTDVLDRYNWDSFTYHDMNYNLLQEARARRSRVSNTQMRTQLGLEVDIMDGLQFNSKFQYETSRYNTRNTNDEDSFYTRYRVNYYTPGDMMGNALSTSAVPAGAIVVEGKGKDHSAMFRNDVSLNKSFGDKHAIAAVLGNEISNYYYTNYTDPYLYGVTAKSQGTVGPSGYVGTMDNSSSAVNGVPANGKTHVLEAWNHNRFVSFYGNASYMYADRYGLSVSARSDASNLITKEPKYRWSPLWSVGTMWNVTNESWLKGKTPLDRLTLRFTYGKNGNAASSSSAYTTLNTQTDYMDEYTGQYPGRISDYGNPTLRWEKTATTNIGLDFSLLDHHLYGTIDYYDRKSTDVLGEVAIAGVNGTTSAVFNNAELNNRGIELTLGGNIKIGQVSLSGTLTYAYNKNKVTRLYNEVNNVSDMMNAYYIPGYPMASIFKMRYGGLKDGIPQILDKQGNTYGINDFSIYYLDWHDFLEYQGTSISPHTAGLKFSANWKGLAMDVYLNGRFGGKMEMPTFSYLYPDSYGGKQSFSAQLSDLMNADGSIVQNPKNSMPLPTTDNAGNAITVNDYAMWSTACRTFGMRVESASYIYLSEIDLAYSLPSTLFSNTWIKGVDIYSKLENVGLLWTANSAGYYPEYMPGSYEPQMQLTIGANVKF